MKKWLIMVYMQASDTSQLDALAVQDLLEMEDGLRENPHVEVLVQIRRRWPGVPQRYHLKYQKSPPGSAGTSEKASLASLISEQPTSSDGKPINMGSREALAQFLDVGFKMGADYNALVLWGHAYGLGFGRFHHDPLTLEEIRRALQGSGKKLQVLATNACTMSYIEAAYQLRGQADYLVASQEFVPLTGLPYRRILRDINSDTEPLDLSQKIVDRYVEDFNDSRSGELNARRGEKVAMTVLSLSEDAVNSAKKRLNGLADAITNLIGEGPATDFNRLDEIRDVFLANPAGDVRPVLDLYSLTKDLMDLCDGGSTATKPRQRDGQNHLEHLRCAASELADVVRPPSMANGDGMSHASPNGSIVVHHREHPDLDGMSGVGVFAPFVVDKMFLTALELDDKKGKEAYRALDIFAGPDSKWVSLVYDRLRLDDDDLDEIVDASGVVQPAQRIQVNQLARAVDAAFNKLDRVSRQAQVRIVDQLKCRKEPKAGPPLHVLGTFGPPHLKLAGDLSLSDPDLLMPVVRVIGTIGPLHLKLASDLSFVDDLAESRLLSTTQVPRTESELDPVVRELVNIETAVQLVEKTTRRVITNRTFGLGPPRSQAGSTQFPTHLGPPLAGVLGLDPKSAGAVYGLDPKSAGAVYGLDPKSAGAVYGLDPKSAGAVYGRAGQEIGAETGALFAYLSSDPQVANLAVCTLMGLAASSLVQLERAAAGVERIVAQFLFRPKFGAMLSSRDYATAVEGQLEEAFGALTEIALQARRTIRRVLAHPVYGLGQGPEGFGQAERDALATSSGFNRQNLVLLSGTMEATL